MIIVHWKLMRIENRKWKRISIKGSFFVNKLCVFNIYIGIIYVSVESSE